MQHIFVQGCFCDTSEYHVEMPRYKICALALGGKQVWIVGWKLLVDFNLPPQSFLLLLHHKIICKCRYIASSIDSHENKLTSNYGAVQEMKPNSSYLGKAQTLLWILNCRNAFLQGFVQAVWNVLVWSRLIKKSYTCFIVLYWKVQCRDKNTFYWNCLRTSD